MLRVGIVVEDHCTEPRFDVAPRNSLRHLSVKSVSRGFDNRGNVDYFEAYPKFRCNQSCIFQSPIIPRLLLRQTYPENPPAPESTCTEHRSHTRIQTTRNAEDKAARTRFFQVSRKKSFKPTYCFFRVPNGERIIAIPRGHDVLNVQARVISREDLASSRYVSRDLPRRGS